MIDKHDPHGSSRKASIFASTLLGLATPSTRTGCCTSPWSTGLQDELKERLDAATFTEGSPTSEHSALRALATQGRAARGRSRRRAYLRSYCEAVRSDEAQPGRTASAASPSSHRWQYGISGAQPSDAVLQILDKAWSERPPLTW